MVFEVVVRVAILRGERGAKREGEGLSGARWLEGGPPAFGGKRFGGKRGGLVRLLDERKAEHDRVVEVVRDAQHDKGRPDVVVAPDARGEAVRGDDLRDVGCAG